MVSFHFGLPAPELLARVKATGAKVISAATTVEEARWLEARGVDAIIAMGNEAGGHRGMFLAKTIESQVGTFALVPQVADAVRVPVIAAGGIADARGLVAALALGASAVQIGTAYMLSPEATTSAIHRAALKQATDADTALTNLFTGRPARGIVNRLMREIGPMSPFAPAFPTAGGALAPLRAKTTSDGSGDFINLWSGQAGQLATEDSAEAITRRIATLRDNPACADAEHSAAGALGDPGLHVYMPNQAVVFYREAGSADAPTVLLLHGFPSASHMFRDLIPQLAERYHVVAPDLPGFGLTQVPDGFRYTFDNLARVVDGFTEALGLARFAVYVFDYGAPVVWGRNDAIFIPPGAEAFQRDLPQAEVHFVDSGHFALETHHEEIGARMLDFLGRVVK